jgi:hypothetical protein
VRRAIAILACLAAMPAAAVQGAVMEREPCDPCKPPHQAKSTQPLVAPTQGAALRAQVEAKLRAPFDAAAVEGWLTRERAAAAGLGFIAANFDAIDAAHRGAIRFEDYKRFLVARGAALD